jgi:predicted nucleic acid-binding protein
MRTVFADTLYWVAAVKPNDPYRRAAKEARQTVGPCTIVTTDEVLCEFVAALAKSGPTLREKAVQVVKELFGNAGVRVVAQSRDSFIRALDRFARRRDKEYSLTDCSSMNAMDAEEIRDVLTSDRHFEQEGYNILIRAGGSKGPR